MLSGGWLSIGSRGRQAHSSKVVINDSPTFRALIHMEKCRVDRGGKEFSLVLFELRHEEGREGEERDSACVIDAIIANLRAVDEIGSLDERRLGVILPSTTMEGGALFARRIAAACGREDLPHEVYTYPRRWLPIVREGDSAPPRDADARGKRIRRADAFCVREPAWKRALDIFGSLCGLALLWPVFLVVAAYIKIVSPGPALFRQDRVGHGGRLFKFVKFRTMRIDNDQAFHKEHIVSMIRSDRPLAKLDDKGDRRIIPGGRLLRRSCVDELPQLFNVLRGDMSLVGPRPCLQYEAEEFLRWHAERFDIMPGLTGLWQVSGKNKLTFQQMIRLDIAYANKMSFWLDLRIILVTVPAIIRMLAESVAGRLQSRAAAVDEASARQAASR